MKLIPRSSDISPGIDGICPGPFPPNGFTVLTDAAYGNGDCFGLYWPIGQEHKLPIVCETYHDEWRIVPAFSSIKKFEEWLEVNDDDPHENGISIEDQDFAANLFRVARKCLSTGRLDDALPLLQRATEQLPEVSEYWLALAIQYRRCKKTEAAAQAALNAYLGNWAFGVPDNKVIHLLSQAADVPNFQDDPVIQSIKEQGLDLSFGGTKENNNYPLMQMCVDTYFAQRKPLQALTLLHNYAWIMSSETTAFQERYDFNIDEWRAKFRQLCLEYFGDSRTQFT